MGLVIDPHPLGTFSVNKIQLGMPACPALQRKPAIPVGERAMFITRSGLISCMD